VKIPYESWAPSAESRNLLNLADAICTDYAQQGYDLTLRQLYYQFVARDVIVNSQKSYDRLGIVVNKGRLAGYLDWNHIVDRTRNLMSLSHWTNPASVIRSAAHSYANNLWADQPTVVEVWVEKEALAGVVERAAEAWDCAWFSCRGYVSQSEMWGAAQRIGRYFERGQRVTILHLGDHDPSGIDMTRDIEDRLVNFTYKDWDSDHPTYSLRTEFGGSSPLEIRRIALNMDQVEQYNPPPNPAKITDSRAGAYIEQYGSESWELDALDPATLDALIQSHITDIVDTERYEAAREAQEADRVGLQNVADRWSAVYQEFGV
jgi:hypothetical protein